MNHMAASPDLSVSAIEHASAESDRIVQWLRQYIGEVLSIPPAGIDPEISFQQLGLDSSAAVGMTGDLADWLGRDLDPAVAYDHPSIAALARALTEGA